MLFVFALLSTACGSARQAQFRSDRNYQKFRDLGQVGWAYHSFCEKHKNGPANADELSELDPEVEPVMQKVKNGEYVIIWNVSIDDSKAFDPQGLSGTILGYEPSAQRRRAVRC